MNNQIPIDFDGSRMVFDAEPIEPTPRCSMTSEDLQILLDHLGTDAIGKWAQYLIDDGTDLTNMLSAELDKRDGVMDAFGTVAAAIRFNVWMMCEATEDCRFATSVY